MSQNLSRGSDTLVHLYLDGSLEFMPFRIGFLAQAQQVGALNAVLVDGRFPV